MEITYLGHSSFKIKTKAATVVTDPFAPEMTGFKFPKTEAEIVTVSHQHKDHNNVAGVGGQPFVVSIPGEYEVKGISIFGYPSFHDSQSGRERGPNNIYVFEAEDLRLAHLGDLGVLPAAEVMEEISGVDVLMVPVGGIFTLGPKEAAELVSKIEPLIVLPMHYKQPGISQESFGKLAEVKDFLTELGTEEAERLEKLSISKSKLPEETKVIVLERKS
ncbi:MAG TPA: MBL fold metallo-hydrolase [Clostridia bacterium]|nr:MBL fold metallo-hydrolase [Clostridia bacterium]